MTEYEELIKETELEITRLLNRIYDVYKAAHPGGSYLSLCICGNQISFNNAYFSRDKEFTLNYSGTAESERKEGD